METMGTLRRTNYCGEVSLANAGQEMTICGSIARARDKGGIIFADLRDTTANCVSAPPRPTRSPPVMWNCTSANCVS